MMKWDTALRATGVAGLVAAYGVYRLTEGEISTFAFTLVLTSIVGVVAPEIVSELPVGPSK